MSENTNKNEQTNTPPAAPPANNPPVDIEALLSKARAEEKQKLYSEIESLKNSKNELEKELASKIEKLNASIVLIDKLEKDVEKEKSEVEKARKEGEKNMGTKAEELEKQIEELQKQLKSKDDEIAAQKTAFEMKEYRQTKLADVDASVHALVTGSTKEEVDASVAKAKETYESIAKSLGIDPATKKPAAPAENTPPANNPPAGGNPPNVPLANQTPPANMPLLNNEVLKKINMEGIMGLDVRSPEYAKVREQLGLK